MTKKQNTKQNAERVIAVHYISEASLLEKARLLSWLVASIDHDTIRIVKKEMEAPSKRECNEIVEIIGYKRQWLKASANHLKEHTSPSKWMNSLDY
jgi:hypothetical protein